jgi:tRNA (guanosine-2'-O-)-methyltransferase
MRHERYAQISEILTTRQPDLTVYMEQVIKPYNVSAIISTADADAVYQMHAVWPTRLSASAVDFLEVDYTCPTYVLLS